MELRSLSASSAKKYEECPAQWKVDNEERVQSPSGQAADLGTLCHMVLQLLVERRFWENPDPAERLKSAGDMYRLCFAQSSVLASRYSEGLEMVIDWVNRQDFTGREVLSTEIKREVSLAQFGGPDVPFRYIIDRMDKINVVKTASHINPMSIFSSMVTPVAGPVDEEYDIEVIDYKTLSRPVSPSDLKHMIQARAYAWVASLEHPEARRIWVTFDLLRHQPVGTVFERSELEDVPVYLVDLANRIMADEDAPEKINSGCRFCSRKSVCSALAARVEKTGDRSFQSMGELARVRMEKSAALKAIEDDIKEMDEVLKAYLDMEKIQQDTLEGIRFGFSQKSIRYIEITDDVTNVLGHRMSGFVSLTLKQADELIKEFEALGDETAVNVLRAATRSRARREFFVMEAK
jgi:CRISPR/Cas system-associated exonuclease Cas4 (RecB family)